MSKSASLTFLAKKKIPKAEFNAALLEVCGRDPALDDEDEDDEMADVASSHSSKMDVDATAGASNDGSDDGEDTPPKSVFVPLDVTDTQRTSLVTHLLRAGMSPYLLYSGSISRY